VKTDFLAALMPERYYERYKKNLVSQFDALSLISDSNPIHLQELGALSLSLRKIELREGQEVHPDDLYLSENGEGLRLWDILLASPRVIVLGARGSGKSVLLRYLAVLFASGKIAPEMVTQLTLLRQEKAASFFMPFYIPLADFAAQPASLAKYLAMSCAQHGFPHAEKYVQNRLDSGECLLLLDGLEDVPEDRLPWVIAEINQLGQPLGKRNQIIVTADPGYYQHKLRGYTVLQLFGLSARGIEEFIAHTFQGQPARSAQAAGLLECTASLRSLAVNPLFFSALLSAFAESDATWRIGTLCEKCLQRLLDFAPTDQRLGQQLQDIAYRLHSEQRDIADSDLEAAEKSPEIRQALQRSGVWVRRGPSHFGFGHLIFQQHLAAKELAHRGEAEQSLDHLNDPRWHETIILIAGLVNRLDFVRRIADSTTEGALFLAARCLAETHTDAPDEESALRRTLYFRLCRIFEDSEARLWRTAAQAIGSIEHKPITDALISLSKDSDALVREQAVLGMGRQGGDWALGPLIEAMDDPAAPVRARAAWALGCLKDVKAVSRLVTKLGDADATVSRAAAIALGRLGAAAVRPLLLSFRDGSLEVRQLATRALTLIGEPAVGPLLETLDKERWGNEARKQAILTLGEIGNERAIAPIIKFFYNPEVELSQAAAIALGCIGKSAIRPLIGTLAERASGVDILPQVVEALIYIGEEAVEDLLKALGDVRPETREAAERALIGIRAPAIPHIVLALPKQSLTVQRRMARILGEIGDESAVETLTQLLRDSDAGVQARIVQALGRIGDKRAAPALLELLQKDQADETVRRSAARALGEIGDATVVEALVNALNDPILRGAAVPALRDLGGHSVEPLLRFIFAASDKETRALALQVLGDIGRNASLGEGTPLGLARTFHYLISEHGNYTTEEMLERLKSQGWNSAGQQLAQVVSTAKELQMIQNLDDAPQFAGLVAWAREEQEWFHPPLRDVLRGLGDVIENVKLYLANRHIGGQEALLSSVDRLNNELLPIVETKLLEFEADLLSPLVAHWKRLLDDVIKQMRGRAQLQFQITAEQILLESAAATAPVVFLLSNMGDSVARNISVTLSTAHHDGAHVIGATTQRLDPLGSGTQREVQFTLQPNGDNEATLTLDAIYDDDEGERHRSPFSTRIRFGTIGKYVPIPESPYIPGTPVRTNAMFFGRQEALDWITKNIGGAYQQNILVLYGERRVGKTSLLCQLESHPPTPRHICIFFTFELAAPRSVSKFLFDMASAIHRSLKTHGIAIPRPTMQEYEGYAEDRFRQFCEDLDGQVGDRVVVLMMDEFGILIEKVHQAALPADTLDYLRGIIQRTRHLTFIFVGAHLLRNMLQDEKSILFNMAKVYRIGYLSSGDAEQLIRRPVAGYLDYADPVVKKILEVTACHPYFIQCICDELVKLAQQQEKNYISLTDLDIVLQKIIEDATGNIWKSLYIYLSEPEKRALAALAEATSEQVIFVMPDKLSELLERHGLPLSKIELLDMLRQLRDRDLVIEERIGQRLAYGFKMGLVRMWLLDNEILLRLKEEKGA
jgi:HEAT repeat protein